jgi:hypothetical protein
MNIRRFPPKPHPNPIRVDNISKFLTSKGVAIPETTLHEIQSGVARLLKPHIGDDRAHLASMAVLENVCLASIGWWQPEMQGDMVILREVC